MTASLGVQAFIFDVGWGELVLIGVVALIVFGPKELPVVLRTVGQYMTKIRRMAAEFQSQFQEAMREAGRRGARFRGPPLARRPRRPGRRPSAAPAGPRPAARSRPGAGTGGGLRLRSGRRGQGRRGRGRRPF